MLAINMEDVKNVLGMIQTHLIVLGVLLLLGIAAMFACGKLPKAKKYLVRAQAGLAMLLAVAVIVNLICFGPLNSMISLATGGGDIAPETSAAANKLCTEIAEEGIVLLKNDGAALPLANKKVNVFGWSSTNPVYGGTGSGSMSDAYPTVSFLEGLSQAGIEVNSDLTDFYANYRSSRPTIGMFGQDWTIPEPAMSDYDSANIFDSAKAFSDTAIVFIARSGGEGADLPFSITDENSFSESGGMFGASGVRYTDQSDDVAPDKHYLELTNRETAMIERVTSEFDDVIVVINSSNAMELGWLDQYSSIKGALLVPGPGQTGFTALGEILTGAVNPSGKTADTFVYDLTATPTWNNMGAFAYDNVSEFEYEGTSPNFVNYVEGIYVGYRFYETASTEGLIDYGKTVQYPFGYGLSYTTFKQEMGPISESNGTITFDVTVTNTGNTAGKEVVEVYYNPPYVSGGIEKASANLIAFDKTGMLEPGASEEVTISFNTEDMASYDMSGSGRYVLEAGDYIISINSDSHNVIDSQTYTVSSTVDYSAGRSTDQVPAVNQFGYAAGDVTYLSRADGFANYAQATAAPASMSMSNEHKAAFINNGNYDPSKYNNSADVMPTTGAKNGLKLVDLRGVDYDDGKWDQLLDQLTVSEMDNLIALGGYQTTTIDSIGKVRTNDCDGPASINNNFTGKGSIGFPAAVMIASTWNKDLAEAFGSGIGQMADEMQVSGWYAPAMNIHRSAFAGRNFEYYSEDGLLSGIMASKAVIGAKTHGVYAYMKHFALNDQETNRGNMLCTWSNEQAIREIYLKPFEMCVKDAGCQAVMSSYNYIGTRWAGASPELLQNVLRDEWGFVGMVLTDYFGATSYMDADQAIRGGTDFCLIAYDTSTNHVTDSTSATGVLAMRQATKNILYTVVNSRAYAPENLNPGMPGWQKLAIGIDVVLAAAFIGLEYMVFKGYKKRETTESPV